MHPALLIFLVSLVNQTITWLGRDKLQEVVRFGWFFLLQRKNPREFAQWLRLLRMGAREDFRRP